MADPFGSLLRHSVPETPYYAYFPERLEENIRAFAALERSAVRVLFALKASNYRLLVERLIEHGFGFDVASPQELDYVLSLGAAPEDLSYSSPSKKEADIAHASSRGIRHFVFDTESEVRKILQCATAPVLFGRLETTDDGAVFALSSKYGMPEEYARDILTKSKEHGWPVRGLSFHVGSQNTRLESWDRAMEMASRCIIHAERIGTRVETLNIGGGMPAPYSADTPNLSSFNEGLAARCRTMQERFPWLTLIAEPGRSIAASTAALVAQVLDIKPYKRPRVAIVDTGVYNGILEGMPHFHFQFPVVTSHSPDVERVPYCIGGFSCDGSDVVRDKVLLPSDLMVGDRIAFDCMGAYARVYKAFHMVPFPKTIVVESQEQAPADTALSQAG